ncbi:MAG: DNA replication/repair protein RecF [Clostridiales bacterium]|nr:DNA replication/repair protein RecF [Clostridiales bacterium]
MIISRVTVDNYRNFAHADITPDAGVTVFVGENAQGKTNLLESVYLCCVGRSHRTSHEKELIRSGENVARVRVQARGNMGTRSVEIAMSPTERRRIKVDGQPVSKSGEMMGCITGVLFAPEGLRIVQDGPAERRRFIDMEISQLHPAYYYALQRYQKALRQRSELLRSPSPRSEFLDVWDEQLITAGCEIIRMRRDFLEKLSAISAEIHAGVSGGKESLTLNYAASTTADDFADMLLAARESDIRRMTTSVGPHRDDIRILINGQDARAYGSQGQQRTAAISMKLSELQVMREETGEWPVLLLDDVMSELDPSRRKFLLKHLDGVQVILTCTDMSDLAGAPVGRQYNISAGSASLAE